MGDASGIGPEIVAKTLAKGAGRTVVFGSYVVMENIVHRLGLDLTVRRIAGPEDARSELGSIEIVEATQIIAPPPLGVVSAISGQASFDAIVAAIAAAKAGKVSGIVTAPINKEAMASAGIRYPGHTEILADYGGAKRVAMMLANDDIRTVLVTIHTSLRKAIDQADFDAQMSAIRLANEGGKASGSRRRALRSQGSTPMPAKVACSATRKSESSGPRSRLRAPRASTPVVLGPATLSTCRPARAASMWSWLNITTRG